ncbi:ENTH/VHS/GAT family protein isoform 1 [Tripterygium wilfordii]|uniref:ENTH/VHS/GAT family protein isoform 1 n=1 Tax=Tripterygium wilfordii TaxID=458696 RepID=A0A7J7DFM7_TRIWF|nr:TOM1-like protein 5 isoform X2 [Tripterygium wilfordii]KAF5745089.1 ENTH/VHS/GAT family protein isoform 1 [Tripterygium wilfordii]
MMAAELVNSATSDKLIEVDWTKNIVICELVAHDQRQAKDVVKAIKKRLESKNSNTQLYAVLLLEMLMNNIGDDVYKQVIDVGILPILVKIVKKKTDFPVREKIFFVLDATQTSLGGAKGKFPQFYAAYYDLVSAGVQFPQRPSSTANRQASQPSKNGTHNGELAAARQEGANVQAETQIVPESSIIQKANNALELLKEVLDAIDPQHPEGARDEFTLDLVEQCSFQKQRVMHLVLTSRDEKVVSRAIELNDQLQKVLNRHDEILSGKSTFLDSPRPTGNQLNHEEAEEEQEEEPEQLFRRMRKGKACARPGDEEHLIERPPIGLLASSTPAERLNRPLIRPLRLEPSDEPNGHPPPPLVVIPPPPAKHIERERFFQENKADGTDVTGHMRGLSLHSRNASSSRSGSFDFSDRVN